MSGGRPELSTVLRELEAVSVDENRGGKTKYLLTLSNGESVRVTEDELFSPTQLQRSVAVALGTVPVNDYPDRDGWGHGVRALEDDLSETVFQALARDS